MVEEIEVNKLFSFSHISVSPFSRDMKKRVLHIHSIELFKKYEKQIFSFFSKFPKIILLGAYFQKQFMSPQEFQKLLDIYSKTPNEVYSNFISLLHHESLNKIVTTLHTKQLLYINLCHYIQDANSPTPFSTKSK